MNKQYEYECQCGYVWLDNENNGCPMCGEKTKITATEYKSLPPEKFNKK